MTDADRDAHTAESDVPGFGSWARKHALENPGHRAREGLNDPGSCDDCTARSPIYDLAACRLDRPNEWRP